MYKIQEATPAHVPEILALWTKLMAIHKKMDAHYFSETDNLKEKYKENLEQLIGYNKIIVAFVEDNLVGYVTAEIFNNHNSFYNSIPYCELGDIMIERDFQNKGLGKVLFEEIKNWSTSNDIQNIRLNVFSKNEQALNFFKKQGFDNLFALLELKI